MKKQKSPKLMSSNSRNSIIMVQCLQIDTAVRETGFRGWVSINFPTLPTSPFSVNTDHLLPMLLKSFAICVPAEEAEVLVPLTFILLIQKSPHAWAYLSCQLAGKFLNDTERVVYIRVVSKCSSCYSSLTQFPDPFIHLPSFKASNYPFWNRISKCLTFPPYWQLKDSTHVSNHCYHHLTPFVLD